MFKSNFFLILVFVSLIIVDCRPEKRDEKLIIINGLTMGTTYTVKLVNESESIGEDERLDYNHFKTGVELVLKKINQQMSAFINDSEISQFNRFESFDWFLVSYDTAWVIKQSLLISEKSEGAFDITVGPLVNLWGFGPGTVKGIPTEDEIKKSLKIVGYKNISVRLSPPSVRKKNKEIYCDLSAIAKGYGVDKLAEYLDSEKISSYLIEIGGELRAKGKNSRNQWWRVGIATPNDTFGIQKVILLENKSMATSGDYHNYFEKDGVRYSHTIDPGTGKPITHNLASVTVIADNCIFTDAMATAINVMGADRGYDLALKENLAVFFIIRKGNRFIEKATPRFKKYLNSSG